MAGKNYIRVGDPVSMDSRSSFCGVYGILIGKVREPVVNQFGEDSSQLVATVLWMGGEMTHVHLGRLRKL